MIKVTGVDHGSIAEELGLQVGTELIAIDGRELDDFLDWEFATAEESFLLHVRQPGGEEIEFDIERPLGEPIGVALEPVRIRRCANRCDFCFVDGLPDGLRDVLYIRDDDYRLSFRYGNFATLTNLKPRDIRRIKEYRLSPLYVSVHATDPTIRRHLLRNPSAPDIIPQLRDFADAGIEFHTQVVMSPGVNDGDVLGQTLAELFAFGPAILGCSVVPVGLTEYSKHHLVREPTAEECRAAIEIIDERATIARAERGLTWAFGADELYLRADVELPAAEIYDGFDQVENGVGAVRWLQRQISDAAADLGRWKGRRIGIVTGTAMAPLMPMVLEPLASVTGARFALIPVVNSLFGSSVTTAGLLPGAAIRSALQAVEDLDLALLPGESLNDDALFIDSLSFDALAESIPFEIRASKTFADALGTPAAA
jgi:putative radical SAM enzyme (TIGR03279 family)